MTIYQSKYQGSQVDNTLDQVNTKNAKIKWGNIEGSLNNQGDLRNALDLKVSKNTTINGKSLSANIVLDYTDVGALSGSIKYGAELFSEAPTGSRTYLSLLDQDGHKLSTVSLATYNTAKVDELLSEKLNISSVRNRGNASLPVYFDSNGEARAITSYNGRANEANTAIRAVNDGSGRNIVATYETIQKVAERGSSTLPVYFDQAGNAIPITSYEGNANTATNATNDSEGLSIRAGYVRLEDAQTITGEKTFSRDALGVINVERLGPSDIAASTIKFSNNGTILGQIGISGNSKTPLFLDGNGSNPRDLLRNQQRGYAVGAPNLPVYIDSSGIAQTITNYGGTAHTAIFDSEGNNIAETYLRNPAGSAPAVDPKLSNLSPEGEERLHSLKSYLDEGEYITDEEGLQDVLSYAYSIFDESKFDLEGNINNANGVISKFSSTSYATCDLSSLTYSNSLEIVFSINVTDTPLPTGSVRQWIFNDGFLENYKGFRISLESDNKLRFFAGTGSTSSWDVINSVKGTHVLPPRRYFLKIEVVQYSCVLYYSTDRINWVKEIEGFSGAGIIPINFVQYFGYGGSVNAFLGSIDLKDLSVILDGALAFSGVQSGIDIIKENNYAIEGSPVVNANGIVSNLSSSNFCKLVSPTFALTEQNNWVIETPIYYIPKLSSSAQMDSIFNFPSSLNVVSIFLSIRDTGSFVACIRNKDNSADVIRVGANFPENMESLQVRFEHDASLGEYKISYSINKGEWFVSDSVIDTTSEVNADSTISFGRNMITGCSMDLNNCKIYVDGNLVYQPCLRIPYFLSNSNSKIVDQFYKDRVDDLYGQQGHANYFTLAEMPDPNYLVYGSTSVSQDYIAFYFDLDSYVRCYVNLTNNDHFVIKGRFKGSGEGDLSVLSMAGANAGIVLNSMTGKVSGTVGGSAYKSTVTLNNFSGSSWYEFIFEYTGTYNQLKVKKETDLEYTIGEAVPISGVPFNYKVVNFGIGVGDFSSGSIDLRAFKVYKNNILSYQAVIEPNYTLPQGDLYGLINSAHNLDSIEVSNSYYPLGDASKIISNSSELGTNWNNYSAPGTYKIQNLTFSSANNSPVGELNSGMLYVMKLKNGVDTDDRTVQMYFPNGSSDNISGTRGGICIREKNGSTWYNWKQIYTKEANDLTYITSSGDQTIEGLKTFASSSVGGALEVKKTGSTSGAALIKFSDGNTTFGYLGINDDNNKRPVFFNSDLSHYQGLIKGTRDSLNAIGSQYTPVYVETTGTVAACIVLNNTSIGSIGYTDTVTGQRLVTQRSVAYWDGRASETVSNLKYCTGGIKNEIVGTLNSQTISGTKTFSSSIHISGTNGNIFFDATSANPFIAKYITSTDIRPFLGNTSDGTTIVANTNSFRNICLRPNGSEDNTGQVDIRYDGGIGLDNSKAIMKYNSTTEAIEFTFE